jgi:4-amino-4-deoxy-L-arabinose transferase-like glycosyltransferase
VALAAVVRVLVLLAVPYVSGGLTMPTDQERVDTSHLRYAEVLRWRVTHRAFTEDEPAYDEMARNIVAGRGFVLDSLWLITTPGEPAMYAGFTYPLFVAGIYRVFGPGEQLPLFLVQIALAAAAVCFVFATARKVAGAVAGGLAAAYYALHPVLIWSSLAMMSEALVVPLMTAVLWLLVCRPRMRGSAALMGALLAVLCLARSTLAQFVPVAVGLLTWARRGWRGWVRRLTPAVVALAVFVACVAPWTIRNYVHWGRLIPFSTKSGAGAWLWNHPGLSVEFGPRAFDGVMPVDVFGPEIQGLPDEAARDARLMELFLNFVVAEPWKFAGLVGVRFAMALLPVVVSSGALGGSLAGTISAWYVKGIPLLALAVGLAWMRGRLWLRMLPLVLFVVYWTLMQSLAGPGLRYRLPADPAWACIVGIIGAAALAGWRSAPAPGPLARRWLRSRGTGLVKG